jgi:outer membrane protein assembly factor BamB
LLRVVNIWYNLVAGIQFSPTDRQLRAMSSCRVVVLAGLASLMSSSLIAAPQPPIVNEVGIFSNGGSNLSKYQNAEVWSLAANNDFVVVGMWPNVLELPQAAFAFRKGTMELVHMLNPVAPDGMGTESLGSSIAISGDLAVVGSRFEHVQTSNGIRYNAGGAHVFDLTTGEHVARLVANDPGGNVFLGEAVAIDGTNVLVGGRAGAAYLFNAISGEQIAKLEPAAPAHFGYALAINGSTALISEAPYSGTGEVNGVVNVYDINTRSKVRTIVPADIGPSDNFGGRVDLDGNTAVVASLYHDGSCYDCGAAYVFDVTTGEQLAKLQHPSLNPGQIVHGFGTSVVIDDNKVVVGVPTDYRHGTTRVAPGAAFLFDWTDGTALAELLPRNIASLRNYGSQVEIIGNTVLVAGGGQGTVYAFHIPEPQTGMFALLAFFFKYSSLRCIRASRTQPVNHSLAIRKRAGAPSGSIPGKSLLKRW